MLIPVYDANSHLVLALSVLQLVYSLLSFSFLFFSFLSEINSYSFILFGNNPVYEHLLFNSK